MELLEQGGPWVVADVKPVFHGVGSMGPCQVINILISLLLSALRAAEVGSSLRAVGLDHSRHGRVVHKRVYKPKEHEPRLVDDRRCERGNKTDVYACIVDRLCGEVVRRDIGSCLNDLIRDSETIHRIPGRQRVIAIDLVIDLARVEQVMDRLRSTLRCPERGQDERLLLLADLIARKSKELVLDERSSQVEAAFCAIERSPRTPINIASPDAVRRTASLRGRYEPGRLIEKTQIVKRIRRCEIAPAEVRMSIAVHSVCA